VRLASRVAAGKRQWRPEYFIRPCGHHDPGVEEDARYRSELTRVERGNLVTVRET
jgi:hypothetical protein